MWNPVPIFLQDSTGTVLSDVDPVNHKSGVVEKTSISKELQAGNRLSAKNELQENKPQTDKELRHKNITSDPECKNHDTAQDEFLCQRREWCNNATNCMNYY